MKIAILTLGSRGDVQPYAVLGQALQNRGHQVTLSTGKNFEKLVISYGIKFKAVRTDYQALLQSDEGKQLIKANQLAVKRNLKNLIFPLVKNSLAEFYQLAQENDKVIYHPKTMADCFADQMPNKMMRALLVPAIQPTLAFANPAFSGLYIPRFINKLSYKLTNLATVMFKTPIKEFRESVGLSKTYKTPETQCIYAISEYFLAKPTDLPKTAQFTGFWFDESKKELPTDLIKFINSGTPPLLITFGSMPFNCKFSMQKIIIKLTQILNIRVVVIKGWGFGNTKDLEENTNVKVIKSAHYNTLFPKVKAVIHHGGIGTTAECLKAGKPFMICPILYPVGDQAFWGNLAHKKGLALKPIPLSKITEQAFISNVKELLTKQSLYAKAALIREKIKCENGLQKAVKIIENDIL